METKNKKATSNRGKAFYKYGLAIAFVALLLVVGASFAAIPGVQAAVVTVFEDDVEVGMDCWTNESLWHITGRRCSSTSHSWWYGQEATSDYDTKDAGGKSIRNFGGLVSQPIDLTTPGITDATLSFWTYWDTETAGTMYDNKYVQVSTDDGATWTALEHLSGAKQWTGWKNIGLGGYIGQVIKIRFFFDTWDSFANQYEGWFIDDIEVVANITGTLPDLNITYKSEEWFSLEDKTYTITYNVTNAGYNSTVNVSKICIYRDGTLLTNDSVPVLDAGQFQNATLGPFTMTGDSDEILVCADCDGNVTECNEDNNCSQSTFEYPVLPDLNITYKSEEWVSLDDKTYNITYNVTNIGDNSTGVVSKIGIYRDGTLLANDPVPVLGAGLFQNKTLGPFTMTGDSDEILVCADCDGDVTESKEGNNCSQNVFEYPAIADIHVNTTGWWWEGNESSYNASGTPIQHAIDNASDGHTIIVDLTFTPLYFPFSCSYHA